MMADNTLNSARVPVILPAATAPSWSGKPEAAITDGELQQICSYADEAGWECGKTGLTESNPFAEDFLGGVPNLLWHVAYQRGRGGEARSAHLVVVPGVAPAEGKEC